MAGLILAAGAGRRFGGPKALAFLGPAIDVMRAGGLAPVIVVLGAAADEVIARVDMPDGVTVVINSAWDTGMASSLCEGLQAATRTDAQAVCVHLVDMPGVTAAAVQRLISTAPPPATRWLARAAYDGEPGHPVLLGRDHWPAIVTSVQGDQGARGYLRLHEASVIECGDVALGFDIDTNG